MRKINLIFGLAIAFFCIQAQTYAQPKLDREQNERIKELEEKIKDLEKINKPSLKKNYRNDIGNLNKKIDALKKQLNDLGNSKNNSHEILNGISISGQMTLIYQSSDYSAHKNSTGTFSTDLVVEKKLKNGVFHFDLQFANGAGVDANAQGGAMVNNDVMEDTSHHNQPYLAKAFYEHTFNPFGNYNLILDIGRFGVNDFFDLGLEVSDSATQFLNQAINNNGAFDFVQDLSGHGYTYGIRVGLENTNWGLDLAVFSSDSFLDNIEKKNSLVAGIKWTPEWVNERRSLFQVYTFKNYGEYGEFSSSGTFVTQNSSAINTETNADTLDKGGFGVSINQPLPGGLNLFAKYGKQDDDRDVRHYQDMDESIMLGVSLQGAKWSRENDAVGLAYHIGKLTGNHKKAHEAGYTSLFDRSSGIGTGNYGDERVLEVYYRYTLTEFSGLSADYQQISNFSYNKNSKDVNFMALRYNLSF